MLKYCLKRLGASLITLVIIISVVFILVRQMPIEGYFDNFDKLDEAVIEATLQKMGLRDPIFVQLKNFFVQLLHGDLGTSVRYRIGAPIAGIIAEKAPISAQIGLSSMAVALVLGIPLGAAMARSKSKFWDKFGTLFIVLITAVPSAVYYIFIQMYATEWFHIPMLFDRHNFVTWLLPIFSMALGNIAYYAMWVRRYMVDEMNKDYVRLARAKGVPEKKMIDAARVPQRLCAHDPVHTVLHPLHHRRLDLCGIAHLHPRHGRTAGGRDRPAGQSHGAGHRDHSVADRHRAGLLLGDILMGVFGSAHQLCAERRCPIMTLRDKKSEALFQFAQYDAAAAEKSGYSNYSYWRSTLSVFLHNRAAVALLIVLALLLLFTFVQPYLPGQYDANVINNHPETGRQLSNLPPSLTTVKVTVPEGTLLYGAPYDEDWYYVTNVMDSIDRRQNMTITEYGEEFCHIEFEDISGWVLTEYLRLPDDPQNVPYEAMSNYKVDVYMEPVDVTNDGNSLYVSADSVRAVRGGGRHGGNGGRGGSAHPALHARLLVWHEQHRPGSVVPRVERHAHQPVHRLCRGAYRSPCGHLYGRDLGLCAQARPADDGDL